MYGVCHAFNAFRDVPPWTVLGGHRHIGFLNTAFNLLEEGVDTWLTLCEPLVCVSIFFFKVGNGVRVIFVAQPSPWVLNIAGGAFPNVFLAGGNRRIEFHVIRVERLMSIACSFFPRARVD